MNGDRLTKTFAYEYVVFNHDPDHPYLCLGVTDDLMLELEGMSGQFAPSGFQRTNKRPPVSKQTA